MRTRNQKTDKKILRKGLSLYRTKGSPYWYARIWNSGDKKYVVRSTKETSRLVAEEVAEELINDLKQDRFVFGVPRDRTFNHYAELLIKEQRRQSGKTKNARFSKDDEKLLNRDGDGIIEYFDDGQWSPRPPAFIVASGPAPSHRFLVRFDGNVYD